jgi:hypothetical protein
MNKYTKDFLAALTWAHSEDGHDIRDASPDEFSPEFIAGVNSFISGFIDHLESKGEDLGCLIGDDDDGKFGHDIYFSLSGHGCGFWDRSMPEGDTLQSELEEYSGNKWRFEEIDLFRNEDGKIDLSISPSFIEEGRDRLFRVNTAA